MVQQNVLVTRLTHICFQRNFQFLSVAAFSVVAICGWCYTPGYVLAFYTTA